MDTTTVADATLIVAIVAAAGGIVAAAWSVRAWLDRGAGRRPILDITTPRGAALDASGDLPIVVASIGGQVRWFVAVLHADNGFFVYQGPLGSNTPPIEVAAQRYASSNETFSRPVQILAAAKDLDGAWWDAFRKGGRLKGPVGEWVAQKCSEYGRQCVPPTLGQT